MYNYLKNKTILITGGTGSFGKSFVDHLIKKADLKKIIIFSRDEYKHFKLRHSYENHKHYDKLRFFIGDIRDRERLEIAFTGVDYVVHAAALKHVDFAEYNPIEYVKTNIIGTQNVVLAAISQKVKKVIVLSTDKAVNPINLYGSTKLAADKLAIAANSYANKKKTNLSVVRYGNVVNSRGSVIPKFIELSNSKEKYLPITDEKMTRFVISLDDAVKFVIQSMHIMKGSEIFLPKCRTIKIVDLAWALTKKIKIIGKRPGEKLHESLISENDTAELFSFKNFYVQTFTEQKKGKSIKLKNFLGKKIKSFEYTSDDKKFLNIKQIRTILNDLLR